MAVLVPPVWGRQIHSFSYLDYILNPCSLIQLHLTLDGKQFEALLKVASGETVYLTFVILGIYFLGEVVSYSRIANPNIGIRVSVLLMPPGMARLHNLSSLSKSNFSSSTFRTTAASPTNYRVHRIGDASLKQYWSEPVEGTPIDDMTHTVVNDSLFSAVMQYRKRFLVKSYTDFARGSNLARPLNVRVAYFRFPMSTSPYTELTYLSAAGSVLFGDVNLAVGNSDITGDFVSTFVKNAQTDVSFTSTSQGLLGAAFGHVAAASPTYSSVSGLLLNEMYDISIPVLEDPTTLVDALKPSPGTDAPSFLKFYQTRTTPTNGIPPWPVREAALHVKTSLSYQCPEGMEPDIQGVSVTYTLARCNQKLFPVKTGGR
jgi:hypothetical protein